MTFSRNAGATGPPLHGLPEIQRRIEGRGLKRLEWSESGAHEQLQLAVDARAWNEIVSCRGIGPGQKRHLRVVQLLDQREP